MASSGWKREVECGSGLDAEVAGHECRTFGMARILLYYAQFYTKAALESINSIAADSLLDDGHAYDPGILTVPIYILLPFDAPSNLPVTVCQKRMQKRVIRGWSRKQSEYTEGKMVWTR